MDRRVWWASARRVTKSRTRLKQLSMHVGTGISELSMQWLSAAVVMLYF